MMYEEILYDKRLQNLLVPEVDPWVNTPFAGYIYVSNTAKGEFGEEVVDRIMKDKGHYVRNSPSKQYDKIISGIQTEIKFSLCLRNTIKDKTGRGIKNKVRVNDSFRFNHISVVKNWERLIMCGVNSDCSMCLVWFDKQSFVNSLPTMKYFDRQQAGKDGGNDDWMFITEEKVWKQFLSEPWVKDINEW